MGGSGEDLYPRKAFVEAPRVASTTSLTLSGYLREEREMSEPRVILFFIARERDTGQKDDRNKMSVSVLIGSL